MISVIGLQKVIQGRTSVDIPELEVKTGEIVGLVGPTGSGIEPLFELLTGRSRATAGHIRIAGIDPAKDKEIFSRKVGVLFADDSIYKNISPKGNLAFYARMYGLSDSQPTEVLARVGLADHASGRADKLSSSLLRRLAFGRAILHNPDVLLLYEPFSRCDDVTINLLSSLMRSLAEEGMTILVLTSDQTHLVTLCDVLYNMNNGRITETGTEQDARITSQTFKIPVRTEDKVVLINPADVLYADASEGRAYLVTGDDRFPTQFTLTELESRLSRSGFFRAHRSYLVNLQHVKEVIPYTRNSFSLRLDDLQGTKIPLSKSAAGELKELLGY